jgi:hypothetical protein
VTLVLDTLDPERLRKVEGAIDHTPRYDPMRARIRIGQGIEIDPEHPQEAVVYLVVMNDEEHELLRKNLDAALPDAAVAEDVGPPSPAVVTQLADVGQLEITPGIPRLGPPPSGLRSHLALPDDREPEALPIEPGSSVPSARASRTASAGREAEGRDDRDGFAPSKPLVYLVWVTTTCPG